MAKFDGRIQAATRYKSDRIIRPRSLEFQQNANISRLVRILLELRTLNSTLQESGDTNRETEIPDFFPVQCKQTLLILSKHEKALLLPFEHREGEGGNEKT